MALSRIPETLEALSGWRRYGVAALSGICLTLAMPPVFLLPMVWIAYAGLIWLLRGCRTGREAFAVGWWFGFGHHVTGLYWVSISLLVEPEKFAWLIPFAVSLIPAVLAVYIGLISWLIHRSRLRGWAKAGLLAFAWVVTEWVRGWLFTGFPWNPVGSVWSFSDTMIQVAALGGIYGLGFLTVMVAALPACMVDVLAEKGRQYMMLAGALVMVLGQAGYGIWRLSGAEEGTVPGVMLRLVQGNIPQDQKWSKQARFNVLETHLRLSRAPAERPVTHVIWSESAIPFLLNPDSPLLETLAEAVPEDGVLLTGVVRSEGERYYNSVEAVDENGRIIAAYDKRHLVPFGEYIPLRNWLPLPIERIAHGMGDFAEGKGGSLLFLPNVPPTRPLICYEAIFPDEVSDGVDDIRPRWLLNVTNDAWFGRSSGPYQHLQSARLRAIEQGVPLVRVANTGISVVTDAYGRVQAMLPLGVAGVLDVPLPESLQYPTVFSRLGGVGILWIVLPFVLWMAVRDYFCHQREQIG